MRYSNRERHEPENEPRKPQALESGEVGVTGGAENVLNFSADDTYWHRRICVFLSQHPGSSLFAVVQHLWPDFLALPANRRAQTWFWAKEQLQRLCSAGVIQCREEADGVSLWSLMPAPQRQA